MASGMAEAEARAVALPEFALVDRIKEQCRDTRRVSWIQDFARDLLYGLRMLWDSPRFTLEIFPLLNANLRRAACC